MMLKSSVPPTASFSVFEASIRCAISLPPPGSAPGYHTDHHWIVIGMNNTDNATDQLEKSGRKLRVRGFTRENNPERCPTSGCCSAKYAAANAPVIVTVNWIESVTSTPHSPDTDAKKMVITDAKISVRCIGHPSRILAIFAAARLTVAMMKQLKNSPR